VNAQDVAALTATMTEDVEFLDDGVTLTGREAVIRALREEAAHGKLTATSREITIADAVAWHVAGLAQTRKDGIVQARGHALEIWKRERGAWRLHRRMTSAVSPDVSVTRPPADEPVLDQPKN
jgi:ketosteroid isomerase-like protein